MSVPEGWLKYTRYHKCIDRTRIIAVKTPLKESFNTKLSASELERREIEGVPLGEEFTPTDLMQGLAQQEKGLALGLVIDLTNTYRYYDGEEFMSADVKYEKLKCVGREIPTDDIYKRFARALRSFLSENKTGIAAVHCTHGLNRTGYLVCRYLVDHCDYEVDSAIKAFEAARGYKIERENYLSHLRQGCPKLPVPTFNRLHPVSGDHWHGYAEHIGTHPNDKKSHSRSDHASHQSYRAGFDSQYPKDQIQDGRYHASSDYTHSQHSSRYTSDRYQYYDYPDYDYNKDSFQFQYGDSDRYHYYHRGCGSSSRFSADRTSLSEYGYHDRSWYPQHRDYQSAAGSGGRDSGGRGKSSLGSYRDMHHPYNSPSLRTHSGKR